MGLIKIGKIVHGITKIFNNSDAELVSYKYTYAAFNDIKQRTEKRIFIFSTIASVIFLCFYGYLIYLNVNVYSLRHIIIYSILSLLLIVSIVFNIVLNPIRKIEMSTVDKSKHERTKSIEKNIVLLISTLTKITSLGFMLYEIITIDSSIKRIIPFGFSTLALLIQLLITYISRLILSFYRTLLVAIDKDIHDSGLIKVLSQNDALKEPISVAGGVDDKTTKAISERIDRQVEKDIKVKEKNNKELIFKVAIYCKNNNPTKIEDIQSEFSFSPSKLSEVIKFLKAIDIVDVLKDKTVRIKLNDDKQIRKRIFAK